MQSSCSLLRFITAMLAALLVAALVWTPLDARAGLDLHSARALVFDRDSGRTLYAKAAQEQAPIASITKLMTAIVLLDRNPDLDEVLTITELDVDRLKNSASRLPVGARLTRREMLHLALMSSENRAAHALARTAPAAGESFVAAMNRKARMLGMTGAQFADPTGLSPANRASALDLRKLVEAASRYPQIRRFTTTSSGEVSVAGHELRYRNSNPVVGRKGWNILLSKTGFIQEAGRVVVVGFRAAGRNVAVVLMGAHSSKARTRDLQKVRQWIGRLVRSRPAPVAKRPLGPAKTRVGSAGKRRP